MHCALRPPRAFTCVLLFSSRQTGRSRGSAMQAALSATARVSGPGAFAQEDLRCDQRQCVAARPLPVGQARALPPSGRHRRLPAVSSTHPPLCWTIDIHCHGQPHAGSRQAAARGRSQRAVTVRAAGGDDKRGERQPWEFGRFLETVLYFNPPPSPGDLLRKLFGSAAAPSATASRTAGGMSDVVQTLIAPSGGAPPSQPGVVLVTGATGGTGRRVVARLLARGRRVRALVRDVQKARQLLAGLPAGAGGSLELVAADVTQVIWGEWLCMRVRSCIIASLICSPSKCLLVACKRASPSPRPTPLTSLPQRQTLLPEMFEGVQQVVSCSAVTVAPKEVRA